MLHQGFPQPEVSGVENEVRKFDKIQCPYLHWEHVHLTSANDMAREMLMFRRGQKKMSSYSFLGQVNCSRE